MLIKAHATVCDIRRNMCFADGETDRSPTGSGVSGRMAIHYGRGKIGTGNENDTLWPIYRGDPTGQR
jgi:proline racemase